MPKQTEKLRLREYHSHYCEPCGKSYYTVMEPMNSFARILMGRSGRCPGCGGRNSIQSWSIGYRPEG